MLKFIYLETHITDHCNLNCAYCFHYAPLAKPRFYDINQFENELKQICSLDPDISHKVRLGILGGEPLLHPQFLMFCEIGRKYFEKVSVLTNGILLKSKPQSFFDKLNELDIHVEYSEYIKDVELENLVKTKLHNYHINRHDGMTNMQLNFNNDLTPSEAFKECSRKYCITLRDGKLYRCSSDAWADFLFNYFNFIPDGYDRDSECINIWECDYLDILKFCNQPVKFCEYCVSKYQIHSDVDWKQSEKALSEWVYDIDKTNYSWDELTWKNINSNT